MKNFLCWLPRITAVLFTLFLSSFALDVLGRPEWLYNLLIHLIPSYLLIAVTIVAWRNEKVGGFLFLAAGLASLVITHLEALIIAIPSLAVGLLFLASAYYRDAPLPRASRYKNPVAIGKPTSAHLAGVRRILEQWTESSEVEKYLKRVQKEIEGITEFNGQYWVATEGNEVLGVVGFGDLLPQLAQFSTMSRPAKFKVLYVDGSRHGRGIGQSLASFVESEARRQGYTEIFARSAERYRGSAYGFYEKMGYRAVGTVYAGDDPSKPMAVFRKQL